MNRVNRMAAVLILCAVAHGFGSPANRTEYQIKAAFLLNFTRFVEWPKPPAGGNNALTVCILGRDPFGTALDEVLNGQTVHEGPVRVQRIAGVSELSSCQVVFLPGSEMYRCREVIESLRDSSVLTVGEAKDFAQRGGVINFVMQQDKVRFQINLAAAARAHLKINFRLLQLAIPIGGSPEDK